MKQQAFADLGISTQILQAVGEMGFETPTKIQTAAIPKILEGRDVAGQAQTGTGKTAAFAIPILEKINSNSKDVQALVMCPTRELAVQVTGEFIKLGSHMKGVYTTPVYGGQPIRQQLKQLKKGTQIVVGTPGRLIDHLKRGTLDLSHLKMVVLDEADEMLNMGFRDDIETILGFSSQDDHKQTVMFSATMPGGIKKLMQRWFQNPEMIKIEGQATAADGVEQYIVEVRDSVRTEAISRILDMNDYRLSLIFCNTKRKCDELVGEMQSRGYSSDVLHGDMSQNVRDKVMAKFRRGDIDLLIATDVAARGLDVENIDAVFNYDIPHDPEYYVHRIGRTGRAGRKGIAYTFASGRKQKNIRYIEKQIKSKIDVIPMPSQNDVRESRLNTVMDEVFKTLEKGGLRPYIEQIEAAISEKYTPIEVAAALLKKQSADTSVNETNTAEKPKRTRKSNGSSGRKKKEGKKNSGKDEPFYQHFVKNKAKKKKGRKKNR